MARQPMPQDDTPAYKTPKRLKQLLYDLFVTSPDTDSMGVFVSKLVSIHQHRNQHTRINIIGDTGYFRSITLALLNGWGIETHTEQKRSVDEAIELHIPEIQERRNDLPRLISFTVCQWLRDAKAKQSNVKLPKSIGIRALTFLVSFQGWDNLEQFRRFIKQSLLYVEGTVIDYPESIKHSFSEVDDKLERVDDEMFAGEEVAKNVKKLFGIDAPVKMWGYKRKAGTEAPLSEAIMLTEAKPSEPIHQALLVPLKSIFNFIDSLDVSELVEDDPKKHWANKDIALRLHSYERKLYRLGVISIGKRKRKNLSARTPYKSIAKALKPDSVYRNWTHAMNKLGIDIGVLTPAEIDFKALKDFSEIRLFGVCGQPTPDQSTLLQIVFEHHPHSVKQSVIKKAIRGVNVSEALRYGEFGTEIRSILDIEGRGEATSYSLSVKPLIVNSFN